MQIKVIVVDPWTREVERMTYREFAEKYEVSRSCPSYVANRNVGARKVEELLKCQGKWVLKEETFGEVLRL